MPPDNHEYLGRAEPTNELVRVSEDEFRSIDLGPDLNHLKGWLWNAIERSCHKLERARVQLSQTEYELPSEFKTTFEDVEKNLRVFDGVITDEGLSWPHFHRLFEVMDESRRPLFGKQALRAAGVICEKTKPIVETSRP